MEIQDLEACDRAVRAQEQLYHVKMFEPILSLWTLVFEYNSSSSSIGGGPGEKTKGKKIS